MKPEIHLIHLFIFQKNINIMSMPLIIIVLQWRLYSWIILFESILSHKHFFKYLRLIHVCTTATAWKEMYTSAGFTWLRVQSKHSFAFKKFIETNMFYTLLLSLKILLNLCILSCKQETTCQILKSRKIQVTQVECSVFSFTSVSLTLKINQLQTVSNFGFN